MSLNDCLYGNLSNAKLSHYLECSCRPKILVYFSCFSLQFLVLLIFYCSPRVCPSFLWLFMNMPNRTLQNKLGYDWFIKCRAALLFLCSRCSIGLNATKIPIYFSSHITLLRPFEHLTINTSLFLSNGLRQTTPSSSNTSEACWNLTYWYDFN